MTYEEQVHKNMELSEQFSLSALEHPEILEQIPEGAHVVFLPEDDPELAEQNQKLLDRLSQEQATVVIVRMRPAERVVRTRVPTPQLEVVRGGGHCARRTGRNSSRPCWISTSVRCG